MKRIITLLLIGMLAFSAFAYNAADTTTLNIEATVARISPTYSLNGYITYGQNDGNGGTSTKTTSSVTVAEGNAATIKAENIRLTSNTNTTKDDNTFKITVALIQEEARWNEKVKVTFNFSRISYATDKTGNQTTSPAGMYSTDYPTTVTAANRGNTLALTISDLDSTFLKTTGNCSLTLDYNIFGYFMKSGLTLTTLTATYDIPDWKDDYYAEKGMEGYFPFGTYTGQVTVKFESTT